MPVSSLIVRTAKGATQSVAQRLNTVSGVSVEKIHDDNIVIVTDTCRRQRDKELWGEFEKIPGVLQCDLIYHNFEDEEGPENV
jgi:nitrate reductase NapAB chaperone NapD